MFLFSKSLTFSARNHWGVFISKARHQADPWLRYLGCTLLPAVAPWHLSFEQSITANHACFSPHTGLAWPLGPVTKHTPLIFWFLQ